MRNLIFTGRERERFDAKFTKTENGCWMWKGTMNHGGYGYFKVAGHREKAHRVAYANFIGKITDGLCVCHKCDVRNCVNPAHLFLGTLRENCQDRTMKGRSARGAKSGSHTHPHLRPIGERNGMSRINTKIATAIFEEASRGGIPQRIIAEKYGVVQQTVSDILKGRRWRSVTKIST